MLYFGLMVFIMDLLGSHLWVKFWPCGWWKQLRRSPVGIGKKTASWQLSSAPKQVNPCVGKSELLKKSRLAQQNPDSLKSSAPKQVRWLMGLWTEHAVVLQLSVDWPSPILPNVPLLMWGSSKRLASSDVPKVTDLPCKVGI